MPLPGPFRLWQSAVMTRLAAASFALLLAACSAEQPTAAPSEGAPAEAASDAAVATSVATATVEGIQSRYTSLKDCKVVDSKEEEDWSVSRCDGLGGYSLFVDYGDARDDLRLVPPGGKPVPLELTAHGGGGFNALADTVEWRGEGAGAGFKPTMLIVRNAVVTSPEQPEQQSQFLVVIDLKQKCVVAQIKPRPAQNEAARAIADGAKQPCLKVGS